MQEGHVHNSFDEVIISDEHRRLGLPLPDRFPLYPSAYANADWVVAYSEFAAESLAKAGIDTDKILINPLGVDLAHFPMKGRAESEAQFRVLCTGTIGPRKGQFYLLEAFRELPADFSLVLRGDVDSDMQPVLRQFEGLYQLAAAVPYVELARFYQEADVFVLPSLSESFGLVILEAMATGLPVIVTEHSASFVTDGYDGFIVPIRDPQAIKQRLLQLYDNVELRLQMGRNARRTAEQYTWEATRARHGEIMRAAALAHAGGSRAKSEAWRAVSKYRYSG